MNKKKRFATRLNYLRAGVNRVNAFLKSRGIKVCGNRIKRKPLIREYARLRGLTIPPGVNINDWLIDHYLQTKSEKLVKDKKAVNKVTIQRLYAKQLRKRATTAEVIFRDMMLKLKIKFKFQHPVNTKRSFYIIDFYISEGRKCVEIDGGYHNNPKQKVSDQKRDKWLVRKGYEVIRLTNERVFEIQSEDELISLLGVTKFKKSE